MAQTAVIGLDLGGTKLAGAIFTPTGKILTRAVVPLAGRRGHEVGKLICSELRNHLAAAEVRRVGISSVGISVPGISRAKSGTVWAPNIPGWGDYPLRRVIRATLQDKDIKVTVDSDRACYILGETWRGGARGCRNAIFLAVGTGIGAGILIDGQVLRGAHDIAGAIGWLALDRPFRDEYVGCGCFEYHASGSGLAKVANALLASKARGRSRGSGRPGSVASARDVFRAYEHGDAIATQTIDEAVGYWGMAVANLVSLFNPEKIVFGGGVFGPARKFLRAIHTEARKWAQPISINQVKLQASKLGDDAGLYGAGWAAVLATRDAGAGRG